MKTSNYFLAGIFCAGFIGVGNLAWNAIELKEIRANKDVARYEKLGWSIYDQNKARASVMEISGPGETECLDSKIAEYKQKQIEMYPKIEKELAAKDQLQNYFVWGTMAALAGSWLLFQGYRLSKDKEWSKEMLERHQHKTTELGLEDKE